MKQLQGIGSWFARGFICLLILWAVLLAENFPVDWLTRADEGVRDALLRIAADPAPESRVILVDIDEESLRREGQWPWSRSKIADLVELLLGHYGARAVGLDIVLVEAGDPLGDARLLALATHAPLVLAQVFDYQQRQPPLTQGVLVSGRSPGGQEKGIAAQGYLANHGTFSGAGCVGNIGYLPELDGVVRKIPGRTVFAGLSYPSLAESLVSCGSAGHPGEKSAAEFAATVAQWRVPFRSQTQSYSVLSASDILAQNLPARLVEGRYVIVGSSSLSLGDRVSTPLEPLTAGFMVHAAALAGLLDIAELRARPSWSGRPLVLLWTVLTVLLAVVCLARLSAWGGVVLLTLLAAGWLGVVYAGLKNQMEAAVFPPLLAYLCLLLFVIPYEWWQAQRKNRQLIQTFSHYVAPSVLEELLRQNKAYSLEPRLREITVLIADMEGYTRMTSSLPLDEAASLTKDFLDCLTRPVLAWRGTLDKYSGDGLVAFWGAPLACPEQADMAVSAGREILAEVDEFNRRRHLRGLEPVRVRVGIESGSALVGDLGTPFRSTYTAVGDCINFASRLESAARQLSTAIAIGPLANAGLLKHVTRSLGTVSLRGTDTRIEVFAPADLLDQTSRD